MPSLRYDIIFSGRVQGVWFRATTEEVARGFAVTGWVRNEPDGSVRCVVEGEEGELDRFIAAVEDAKRANIDETRISRGEATGEFSGFSVRS
jgi:acylphosphatase